MRTCSPWRTVFSPTPRWSNWTGGSPNSTSTRAGSPLRTPAPHAGTDDGIFTDDTRRRFTDIISALGGGGDDGCDAVALVCTEFPVLLPGNTAPLPTLDSSVLLAHAAAELAIDPQGTLPVWRGGR